MPLLRALRRFLLVHDPPRVDRVGIPRGKCVWCGDGGLSTEDVVGKQFIDLLDPGKVVRVFGEHRGTEKDVMRLRLRKRVCTPCNNEWMARLDDACIALMGESMKSGRGITLAPTDQRLLAFWATKIALLAELASRTKQKSSVRAPHTSRPTTSRTSTCTSRSAASHPGHKYGSARQTGTSTRFGINQVHSVSRSSRMNLWVTSRPSASVRCSSRYLATTSSRRRDPPNGCGRHPSPFPMSTAMSSSRSGSATTSLWVGPRLDALRPEVCERLQSGRFGTRSATHHHSRPTRSAASHHHARRGIPPPASRRITLPRSPKPRFGRSTVKG